MNIGSFIKSLGIAAIIIMGFILFFYSPSVWQMWIDYIMITPVWTTIGQMGFLILAILFFGVGVHLAKELVFG